MNITLAKEARVVDINEQIKRIVSGFKQLPYLFIGTGFSIRYANAMSWWDLLFSIWKNVYDDNEIEFEKGLQRIEYELSLETSKITKEQKKYYVFPQMALELQKEFNTRYYNDSKFEKIIFSKAETEEIIRNKHDPFKYYVTKLTQEIKLDDTKKEYGELVPLIKNQSKIAGIITTNYDECLEEIFKDFDVNIGQDNMLLANINSAFEIYKIHGGVSKPNSLVFTKEGYDYFEAKLKYLSAKLLTIFVEHPIIFIGYGMGDPNIQNLFREISECLTQDDLEKAKSNFIFISPKFGGEDEIKIREFNYGPKRIPMTELVLNDYSCFYEKLDNIVSSMPVKLMRKIQDMVTKYIYSTDVTNNIMFGNINSPDIDDDKAAIYVGSMDTISQMGFETFGIMDILEDVLYDNKPFLCNEKLITKTFKNIRSTSGKTFLPVYKYVHKLEMNIEDIPSDYLIIKDCEDIAPSEHKDKYVDKDANFQSLQEITAQYPDHIPKQLSNIKYYAKKIKAEDLWEYLKENYENGTYFEKSKKPTFKKLTALYDFLKYK